MVKDSWQYVENDDEGALLDEVTNYKLSNVALCHYHGIVHINEKANNCLNVRRGMDLDTAV